MAQVKKLENGKNVPKVNGNISYNGTISEFSDEIYNNLIKKLDTGAASGVIRKGLDIGKQQGNTFYYDSEKNRAYVVNEKGEKVWDYQASIGGRSNFKVKWQGTFGRDNVSRNPNDVNRLLQSMMSSFDAPDKDKKALSTDDIKISLGDDKTVSIYDADFTKAKSRLLTFADYYADPSNFTNTYNFTEDNPWRQYLDLHKDNVNLSFGEKFGNLLTRLSTGTYTVNDEEFLNSIGIKLIVPQEESGDSDKKSGDGGRDNGIKTDGNTGGAGNGGGNNNPGGAGGGGGDKKTIIIDETNLEDNQLKDKIVSEFSNYYLPTFYDATVTRATGHPDHLWTGASSWTDSNGMRFLELTNKLGNKYYVVQNKAGAYLRSNSDKENIFLNENDFWDLVQVNGWTPDPMETWPKEKWMPRTQLVSTQQGAPHSVFGLENLTIGKENIPIRKDVNGPNYYAQLKSGTWVVLSEGEYKKLKSGDLSVLENKSSIEFYKKGGILKMQNAGNVPTYDMTATYYTPVHVTGHNAPISNWDKTAIVGTGVGTTGSLLRIFSTNPTTRRVANILSLLGYGTAAVGNTVSGIQNGTWGWDDALWTAYGLARGVAPRAKQSMHYTRNTPVPKSVVTAPRHQRMWYGVKNYAVPGFTRVMDPLTGVAGATFGSIGMNNIIQSINNDPNKTWNWNTWTSGDAQNFQMGLTGLGTTVNATANLAQNMRMRKFLPQNKTKFGSLDEAKFATQLKTRKGLQKSAETYLMESPIKEAFFGNPYTRAYNTAMWNRPTWRPMFTTSPAAFGLTGGLSPYTIIAPHQTIIEEPTSSTLTPVTPTMVTPADTVKVQGGMFFKNGGKVLKMQDAAGGTIPLTQNATFNSLYQKWLNKEFDDRQFGLNVANAIKAGSFTNNDFQNWARSGLYGTGESKIFDDFGQYNAVTKRARKDESNLGSFFGQFSLEGSLAIPALEALKAWQSMATTKANTAREVEAIEKSGRIRQPSHHQLMQQSYDFSNDLLAFDKSASQWSSAFNRLASSTSDNNQVLSGFGMFGSNLSAMGDNLRTNMSNTKSATDKVNMALFSDWADKEWTSAESAKAITADTIERISASKNTGDTNISKDWNTGINALQNWIYQDKTTGNSLTTLLAMRDSITKQMAVTSDETVLESLRTQLIGLNQQIAEASAGVKILPRVKYNSQG